jgi:hypothetical protein
MLGETLQTTYYGEGVFSIGYIHEEQSYTMAASQIYSELARSFAFEFSYRIKCCLLMYRTVLSILNQSRTS